MSHTTEIKSVPIKSISALQSAVEELKAEGVNCELVENQKPRMYYPNQHGVSPYVLKLPNCRYDIGFDLKEDGTYAPVLDTWADEIQKQIGASCPMPNTPEAIAQKAIGQLMQKYSKHAVIEAATAQGYMVEDTFQDQEGNYQVVCSVG